MRVMIVVTHLLGTGHLARALTLARAYSTAGHDITVVSGGLPVPHFDAGGVHLAQLPPLRSDGTDFTTLLDADGMEATARYRTDRITRLLDLFRSDSPDVLITELFPFGRRTLRDEFSALLEAAHGTVVFASVRDILAPPSKPAKAAFADEMVQRHYAGVLVHADPQIITLDRSWPVSDRLAPHLHYTGFVAPPAPMDDTARGEDVVVSAGGGSVGDAIFETALAAGAAQPDRRWHLLVGGDPDRRAHLSRRATPNVRVEAPRADFRALLARAAASVSMCGYNTALDLLQTGTPAVIIPFDDGHEVEQSLRAEALGALPGIAVLRQAELTPEALQSALQHCTAEVRAPRQRGMDGAAETVRITQHLWNTRHGTA
ncbi:MAG: glycosyltransferase [Pseudomonadota bacterium]